MTFIADACALIVFHGYGGQTMSEAGKLAMSHGDVFVSPITLWEISRKVAMGKLERPAPPGFNGSLAEWLRQAGYRVMPLSWDDCERANGLPYHHKDPMDRMLIATALDRGLTIISDGDLFQHYGVATVW
ncbi:MAG: PIN domain-containing protein [Acetobacteraceae bacterium]|nr:PIN domain-containing protein [Acetobacteraceae bacterium]